jgi:uncharacterized membrane protein YeaQ/YmgE (transglycosylase-associated protein family)
VIAPGCLAALLLPLLGAVLGQWLDGSEGGLAGLAVGFVLGCALGGLLALAISKMRQQ